MKKFFLLSGIIVLTAIVLWLSGSYFYGRKSVHNLASIPTPISVSVQKMEPEDITLTRQYIGHVQAIQAVSVHPYISGFIEDVFVKGGEEVHVGDILFTLQQDQYLAEVESAEARVAQSKADLEKARLYWDRLKKTASAAISATEMDNARTAFLSAEAEVANAQSHLKSAMINYNYTTITATIDGVVGNITVTPGQYVSPQGQALAYILQYDPIRVEFYMPDKEFLSLGANVDFFKTGLLRLKLANGEIFKAKGTVLFADNKITENTSSIALFADFENPDRKLLPNAYVSVLYEQNIENALMLDRRYVSLLADGSFVYTLKQGIITKTKIQLGGNVEGRVYIEEGLNPGDLVITEPISVTQLGQTAVPREE